MKVLITGADGFIGQHLRRLINNMGIQVVVPNMDVTDVSSCESAILSNKFDVLVHLAGISSVYECEADVSRAFRVNVEGTYRLAALAVQKNPQVHFIFPSTGQVYAVKNNAEDNQIYSEEDSITPRNLYALTKYLAEEELRVLSQMKRISVTALRIFNHVHKSQRPDFFLASVYRQMLSFQEQGQKAAEVTVGSIDISRDFGAIQDLLDALMRVILKGPMNQNEMSVFNISSGTGKNLRTLVDCLADQEGLSIFCKEDLGLVRTNEPKSIVASNLKFSKAYSWLPMHSSNEEQLVKAFLADL